MKYFHKVANARRERSAMLKMEIERILVEFRMRLWTMRWVTIITLYIELHIWRPWGAGRQSLEGRITEDEVVKAVNGLARDKALVSDEFVLILFQRGCDFCEKDVMWAIDEFQNNEYIDCNLNNTFTSFNLSALRPISLLGFGEGHGAIQESLCRGHANH